MARIDAVKDYLCFIGRWLPPGSGAYLDLVDPFLAKPRVRIPRCDERDVDTAVSAARRALDSGEWGRMHPTQRGAIRGRFGDLIARDADHLAAIEIQDNGKLYAEMRGQLGCIPQWFHYFGGLADKIEGTVLPIDNPDMFTYTTHEPVGVVAAITPWNSPLMLATWKLAQAVSSAAWARSRSAGSASELVRIVLPSMLGCIFPRLSLAP